MVSRQASESRSQSIYDDLYGKITAGTLAIGTRLPTERELADTYGAARNTVRKTMMRLASEGLVRRHVGRGSFVASPETETSSAPQAASRFPLNELLEARLLFEPALVELVLKRASDEELAALTKQLSALSTAKTWAAFKEAKYALHLAIIRLSGNSFLEHVFNEIVAARREVAWQRTGPVVPLSLVLETTIKENADIVAALRARDGKRASELIRGNLLRVFLSVSAN